MHLETNSTVVRLLVIRMVRKNAISRKILTLLIDAGRLLRSTVLAEVGGFGTCMTTMDRYPLLSAPLVSTNPCAKICLHAHLSANLQTSMPVA